MSYNRYNEEVTRDKSTSQIYESSSVSFTGMRAESALCRDHMKSSEEVRTITRIVLL